MEYTIIEKHCEAPRAAAKDVQQKQTRYQECQESNQREL
jgi:hypothetical protein